MTNYVIHAEPAMAAITPYGMAMVADDLFKMAHAYEGDREVSLARYYLYCASIELGLKAAILATDCTKERKTHIKDLGHDLYNVRDSFEVCYAPIWDDADKEAIEKINPFFKKKGLEYFTIDLLVAALRGYSELPEIARIGAAAQKVNSLLSEYKLFIDAKTSEKPAGGIINFV